MRVFLDANVLFAASHSTSPTGRLIALLLQKEKAVSCTFARQEAERNVELKWPARAKELSELLASMEIVPTVKLPLSVTIDEKDAPILSSAIVAKCDWLATGDKKHFGHLFGQIADGVKIITLLQLAEEMAR